MKVREACINLTCRDCGKEFVFTEGEQDFYERMGFTYPSRCRECRSSKEKQNGHLACLDCGIKLPKDAAVYCETCLSHRQSVSLTCSQCGVDQEAGTHLYCETCCNQIHLDSERKVEKYKRVTSATELRLETTECQNEELQRSLYESKQHVAELELRVKNLSQDLDKAYQFHIASGWLKPVLENMTKRLRALEQAEQETESSLATAVCKLDEMSHNGSLWKMISRHIRPLRR